MYFFICRGKQIHGKCKPGDASGIECNCSGGDGRVPGGGHYSHLWILNSSTISGSEDMDKNGFLKLMSTMAEARPKLDGFKPWKMITSWANL